MPIDWSNPGAEHPGGSREWLAADGVQAVAKRAAIDQAASVRESKPGHKPGSHSNCFSGTYRSPKAGQVHHRSSYEYRYYAILDADPEVLAYEAEPFVLPYRSRGKKRNYIPDLLVVYADRVELAEIKPVSLVGKTKNKAKAASARRYCKVVGVTYRTVTEVDLKAEEARLSLTLDKLRALMKKSEDDRAAF